MTPQDVYDAICKDINTMEAVKCIAALENNWYNVTFDNEHHCQRFALQGIRLGNTLLQCERTNVINSAVVYIKAPYEMTDEVVTNVLLQYGTVTNIRRQVHEFDNSIETGVRSCLVRNIKKPIPSYLKVGIFSLPVRYKGQEKTCKICNQQGHFGSGL